MRIKNAEPAIPEVDMTPMIDIVFQLIAFFMVITNFENLEADERVKLPSHVLAKPPEVKPDDEVMINVGFVRDKDGSKLDQEPFVFPIGDDPVRVLDFGGAMQQERRLLRSSGQEPQDTTVIIRADGDVPTGLVQELIKLSQDAEFVKFAIKAIQKTD